MVLNPLTNPLAKTPLDNAWHPLPGGPRNHPSRLDPSSPIPLLSRFDLEATAVDTAPFVAGAGSLAHLHQLPHLGWTAPALVVRNPRTMGAMHRVTLGVAAGVLVAQGLGWAYRGWVPRWSHERERRRDDGEVRKHVRVGMGVGGAVWAVRLVAMGMGRWWAPVEVVLGGAIADVLLREYGRAHGF